MSDPIYGNMIGGASSLGKTLIITDENGVELTGVITEKEVVFTANAATDIREGKVAATGEGIVTGSKVIPSYHTTEGVQVAQNGSVLKITSLKKSKLYEFTKLQSIICDFNTSLADSVSASKVSIGDNVYTVQSTEALSAITINDTDQTIEFGVTNNTGKPQVIRFITYKEIE